MKHTCALVGKDLCRLCELEPELAKGVPELDGKTYTFLCNRCGESRRMQRVTTELGHDDLFCVRWCGCPTDELVGDPNETARAIAKFGTRL